MSELEKFLYDLKQVMEALLIIYNNHREEIHDEYLEYKIQWFYDKWLKKD